MCDHLKVKAGMRSQLVPAGTYFSKITDIKRVAGFGSKPTYVFLFEIVDGPHRGVNLCGFVPAHYYSFSEYTKN